MGFGRQSVISNTCVCGTIQEYTLSAWRALKGKVEKCPNCGKERVL